MTIKEKESMLIEINKIMNYLKTKELNDFEKVCPTDLSFNRVRKDVHDRFDDALEQIKTYIP